MNRQKFIEDYGVCEKALFLDEDEGFAKGIVGITNDKQRIVYGFDEMVGALAESYQKEWEEKEHSPDEEVPDFNFDALEWIDYNTLRAIPYYGENRPVVVYRDNDDESIKNYEDDEKFSYISVDITKYL